ncbi:PE-PPE domain-containing protein [Mycobacterium sp. 1164985.4]|uniref:PE-PPE domain-containing protein n=1 Tax=Mycobacterium sp. 1164985.4 TaxID=1834069 RepID=UPI0007FF8762|nr:PE-PPE domain-containing protein [Mycobacterium sp. 1164985.4]OBK73064.1 hypothetical protein A5650_21445 [Mycobacterium sp. 1164985.4]
MREAARVVVFFFLSVVGTAVLGVVTALMSAVSLAATTALIVPGTGTPDAEAVGGYMQNAQSRYLAPFSNCDTAADCNLVGIPYPASFFPLVIFPGWCVPGRCETWNASVGTGVENLYTALQGTSPDGQFVVFGYSQGGAVVSDTLRRIVAEDPKLLDKISSIVLIGNAYNPDGGLFTRLGFLPTIPFLDITFGPATPIDTGIPMTSIGFEYDPVMYAPLYWGNPLAMLNALAAFDTVHGYYLTPNQNGPHDTLPYGYTNAEVAAIFQEGCPSKYCRVDQYDNEYWMIPAKSLPLMDFIMSEVPDSLKPAVQPIVDLISPAAKVIIDLAYDWSGDPGETRYLSLLPFSPATNWEQVSVDLIEAVAQGIEDAFGDGATTTIAPADEDASTLAARMSELQRFGRSAEVIETEEPLRFSSIANEEPSDSSLIGDDADGTIDDQVGNSEEPVVEDEGRSGDADVADRHDGQDVAATADDVVTSLKDRDETNEPTVRHGVTVDRDSDGMDAPAKRQKINNGVDDGVRNGDSRNSGTDSRSVNHTSGAVRNDRSSGVNDNSVSANNSDTRDNGVDTGARQNSVNNGIGNRGVNDSGGNGGTRANGGVNKNDADNAQNSGDDKAAA